MSLDGGILKLSNFCAKASMKLHHLKALAHRLKTHPYITRARRVEDNVIELALSRELSYFFDMTRGHSMVYVAPSQRPMQGYNAPFDTLLHAQVSAARIVDAYVVNDDRVLRLILAPKSDYKDHHIALQFEFTGKNTNAILLDEDDTVIEALRHIDAQSSFRVVRPGTRLDPLPSRNNPPITNHQSPITDETLHEILVANYQKRHAEKLAQSKRNKRTAIQKQIVKFDKLLAKISDSDVLESEAEQHQNTANILLANLYKIQPYDSRLETVDFEGNPMTIALPKSTPVNRMPEHYFSRAKRAKSRAKNVHIEMENLTSKKRFYENILHAIEQSTDLRTLELLVPKRGKSQRKKEKMREGELFWIEDYKVMVGRNSTENQHLLKLARANDLWMHVRGIPSSHVIIRTDKQNLPDSVIQAAAKLCVDFSIKHPGDYDVDYTQRKFVKIQEGSHVEYDKYRTVRVRKEGVEIRE